MTDATLTTERPVERRGFDPNKTRIPHTSFLREFQLPDGRPILIDKRALAFITPDKEAPATQTIIAFRAGAAKPCPVTMPYEQVRTWWFGDAAVGNGRAS